MAVFVKNFFVGVRHGEWNVGLLTLFLFPASALWPTIRAAYWNNHDRYKSTAASKSACRENERSDVAGAAIPNRRLQLLSKYVWAREWRSSGGQRWSEWPLSRSLWRDISQIKYISENIQKLTFLLESPPGFCLSHFSENWSLLHSENILFEEEPKLSILKKICEVWYI